MRLLSSLQSRAAYVQHYTAENGVAERGLFTNINLLFLECKVTADGHEGKVGGAIACPRYILLCRLRACCMCVTLLMPTIGWGGSSVLSLIYCCVGSHL